MKENIQKKEEKVLAKNVVEPTVTETIDVVEEVKVTNETVVEDIDTTNMTMDQKIDAWINKYKHEPKIIYNDVDVLCLYDNSSETVSITDRASGNTVKFIGKDFFEDAVFVSNTRPEKAQKVRDKYKEITGYSIGKAVVEVTPSNDAVVETTVKDTEMDQLETSEEFVLPEI